ncbi:MAG: UDP-N-acetyl-D-mannosamine dehydrogenase [Janthinobacterium lividum]
MSQTVSFIGLGYIGLPTAALVSSKGINVFGCDINPFIVEALNNAQSHIVEPGIEELIQKSVKEGNLKAFVIPQEADVYIIAVPTPFKDDYKPDLSYVFQAAESISHLLKQNDLVILESTSPVGTTQEMVNILKKKRPDLNFGSTEIEGNVFVAYCPERIIPGFALKELISNDRVVGGICSESTRKAIEFYKQFVEGDCIPTDAKTAEMTKLTENSFRDVSIAFANELSIICDKLNINVWELIKLANHHPRVNILNPGPGVGGHCIAVDPWFIVSACPEEAKLIKMAREINDFKPKYVVSKILDLINQTQKKTVSLFGLAFKPNIDDLRESPSIEILKDLAENNNIHEIFVVEPHIMDLPKSLQKYDHIKLTTAHQAIESSDILVMLVGHESFKKIELEIFKDKQILDFQGIWIK